MSGTLRAVVDTDVCIGTGYCEATAPELFEVTDAGTARVLVDDVPPELVDKARQAAADCPTRALKVTDA
jgi:ferredoxin